MKSKKTNKYHIIETFKKKKNDAVSEKFVRKKRGTH